MPRRLSVLVVDDLADAADSLALALTLRGFDARAAYSGRAALASTSDRPPDAAVLDLRMAGMDGFRLAPLLRAACPTPPLLVAVSGLGTEGDRAQTAAAGFDRYFLKPADVDEVVALLDSHAARLGPG